MLLPWNDKTTKFVLEKNESRISGKQKAYTSYYNVYNPFYIKFNKMEYMNSNLDQIWKKDK